MSLADTYDCNVEVNLEILIWLDYYMYVVMEVVIKSRTGSVALRSKFGYILSGPLEDMKQSSLATNAHCATRDPSISGTITNLFRDNLTSEESINHSLDKFWDIEKVCMTEDESESSDPSPIVYDGS